MTSRDAILAAVRRAVRGRAPAPPTPPVEGVRFDDRVAAFAQALEAAGGVCAEVAGEAALAALPEIAGARDVASWVGSVPSTRQVAGVAALRELADVDVAVLPGELGVAESGAVWVRPADEVARAALFLAERVVLALARDAIVDTLHDAYPRITPIPGPFACFVAGPSKTADIEQALVIGAHGPRSLCVALLS